MDEIKTIQKLFLSRRSEYYNLVIHGYNDYVTTVSRRDMAASLPCCFYLLALYEHLQANSVLDLGSGFSSFCLRALRKQLGWSTTIWSVDTENKWLRKSRDFCQRYSLGDDNFFLWSEIEKQPQPFDLIFVDIDRSAKRKTYFKPVFEKFSRPGSYVYFDDIHKPQIREPLMTMVKKLGFPIFDVRDMTLDRKRYSTLVIVGGEHDDTP